MKKKTPDDRNELLFPLDEPQLHSTKIRKTSKEAYSQILKEGLLPEIRLLVYKCLYHHGPLTGSEVNELVKAKHGGRDGYHKRLSELRRSGVVEEVGERKCSVTGRNVIIWDVTNKLPRDIEAPQPYLLKTDAEPGIVYCKDRDTLITEVTDFLLAYEENGESPESALRCMQVAKLESNHGVLEPATEHLEVVYEGTEWSVE